MLVLCKTTLKLKGRSWKAWTLRTASSLCMHECLFYKAHALFFTTVRTYQAHTFCFTNFWTYQTHVLFFSPPCELIKLMHSFFTTVKTDQAHALPFHHRVNLSGSCTLFFHHRVNLSGSCTPFSPPCKLIRLTHSFFTTVWTYQAHALPLHHHVNLSGSCTLFFTTG